MRFLLRLLLVLALGSYLWGHYGLFVRQRLSSVESGGNQELQRQVPTLADSPLYRQPAQALTPPGLLPRRDLTPGAIDPRVTQSNLGNTICRRGYTATVRPPFEYTNAMKHRLMRVYGVAGSIHDYELDHLIPLELGGCPDCETNLWPQARNVFPGAAEKDEVENYLHREVCSGGLALAKAQREIAVDWYAVYERIHAQTTGRRSD
jgi:hypothetical protein